MIKQGLAEFCRNRDHKLLGRPEKRSSPGEPPPVAITPLGQLPEQPGGRLIRPVRVPTELPPQVGVVDQWFHPAGTAQVVDTPLKRSSLLAALEVLGKVVGHANGGPHAGPCGESDPGIHECPLPLLGDLSERLPQGRATRI